MDAPVVVIGGGIVGSAISYELQQRGAPTILVERDVDPQGASAFSFGSLSAFDDPDRDVYLIKSQGMVEWQKWAERFGPNLSARFAGELRWAEGRESAPYLTSLIERAISRGYPAQFVTETDIKKYEPASAPRAPKVASFAPADGQLEPLRAIEVLRGAFAEAGGNILIGRASLTIDDDGILVRIGEDRLRAWSVIVAAGAETMAFLERLGWEVPMEPSPGLLAVTSKIEPFLRGTVYVYPDGEIPIHLRQLSDGRVLIGERAQDHAAKDPTIQHAKALLKQATKPFPVLEQAEIEHFTLEWRPMPRDHKPIVGPLPGMSSLYVATGHSGVTIAPALARYIAEELLERTEVAQLKSFRPTRFSVGEADAARNVEEAFNGATDLFIG